MRAGSDTARLAERVSDDPDLIGLIEFFMEELQSRIASLERAAREGDATSLRRLAHQFKGAAAGYGFPALGRTAGRIEQAVRALEDMEESSVLETTRRLAFELIDACRSADEAARHVLASQEQGSGDG